MAEERETVTVKYDDIFSDKEDQGKAISILMRLLEVREEVLEETEDLPVGFITGPSLHCTNNNVARGNI